LERGYRLIYQTRKYGWGTNDKGSREMNQEDGFRCPSCAWPVPENPSKIAEYCENGAKALADEATTEKIGADFFKKHSVEALSQLSDFELNKFGRLIEPLVLKPGKVHYEPISWGEAYKIIAEELHQLHHPDEAIFYTSGRSTKPRYQPPTNAFCFRKM